MNENKKFTLDMPAWVYEEIIRVIGDEKLLNEWIIESLVKCLESGSILKLLQTDATEILKNKELMEKLGIKRKFN